MIRTQKRAIDTNSTKLYFQTLVTYIVVDVAYQAVIGLKLLTAFLSTSPLKEVYVQPTAVGAGLMLLFFCIIAMANLQLCIRPGLADSSPGKAALNGGLLGLTAYGTLALTNGWSLGGFPLLLSLTITVEGLIFSMVTSGAVTWWHLRGKAS